MGVQEVQCTCPVPSTWATPPQPPGCTPHPTPPCPHALPLCAHAGGCRRDNAPTPSPLHLGYANPAPCPPAYAPRPTCMPSPFATGGTVPWPVPSARLCKTHCPVYTPTCVQGGGCVSGAVCNPGGAVGKWKGGCTKAGVQKGASDR